MKLRKGVRKNHLHRARRPEINGLRYLFSGQRSHPGGAGTRHHPLEKALERELPTNYDSGKEYRGVNILTLGIAETVHGLHDPFLANFSPGPEAWRAYQKG